MSALTRFPEQTVRAGLYPYHFPWEESGDELVSFPQFLAYVIFFAQDQVCRGKHKKHSDLVVIQINAGI